MAALIGRHADEELPVLDLHRIGAEIDEWLSESADREMAAVVVDHLIHLIATVSPGAKKGSTAPYTYADLLLVEAGERQPRTLANAFRDHAGVASDMEVSSANATGARILSTD